MKVNGKVQGNLPSKVIITADRVYVHSNIVQVDTNLYEYDEVEYTIEEYQTICFAQTVANEADIADCNEALIELAEIVGG